MRARVWSRVTRGLRALGHRVHPVELPGLGDPSGDVSGIDLSTHVDHALSVIEAEGPSNVIVVGHGYSGIVAGILADRLADRVAHTVFLEGFLPHHGRSMLDAFSQRQRAEELRLIAENGGRWPPPDVSLVADGQDLSVRQATWLVRHFAGHPGRTLREPAVLRRPITCQRATYVVCTLDHFDGMLADDVTAALAEPAWTMRTLETGRWPMVSAPGELTALLDDVARATVIPTRSRAGRRSGSPTR